MSSSGAVTFPFPVGAASQAFLRPTAALAENCSRMQAITDGAILTSGTLRLVAIPLPAGLTVTSLTFNAGATAAGTPLNQWGLLCDQNRVGLVVSTDDTVNAWAANAIKAFPFTAPFVTTYSGLYYAGLTVVATVTPSLLGVASSPQITNKAPTIGGNSTAGLTTPPSLPFTAAAVTPGGTQAWCYIS